MKFNMTKEQYDKLAAGAEHAASLPSGISRPINEGETLEPCVSGLKNISSNPSLRTIVKSAMREVMSI